MTIGGGNLRKLRIFLSIYLVIILTTNPIFAEPNQSGELSVIDFDPDEENTESPLLSITGFGFDEKICAADSRWPDKDSEIPMPLNSSRMIIKSSDNERNLTIITQLRLIPKDSDAEDWYESTFEKWEGGTDDLYADSNDEKEEEEEDGRYLKFVKSDTNSFNTKFMIIWPTDYDEYWDGDWPEESGLYSAILRIEVEKTDTQGNWLRDDYLQTLEYGMGQVEVISQGENCFPPEKMTFLEVIQTLLCGIPSCFLLLWVFAYYSSPKETLWLTSEIIRKIRSKPVIEIQEPSKTKRNRSRHISNKVRSEVWARDNGQCVYCNSSEDLQFDHIIPFSKGGSNAAENLQILCKICNQNKSDKI